MEPNQNPDVLRDQMATVRWALARDVHGMREDVETLTDWRFHYRNHPWVACGAAAAVGYLLVPQPRPRPTVITREVHREVPFEPFAKQPARAGFSARSLAMGLLGMAASAAARQAAAYAQQHGREMLERYLRARAEAARPEFETQAATEETY